jgi:hypothetical protein
MAVERWVAGAVKSTFLSVFGTEINSIVNGNAILSSILIDNSASPGDMFAQVSVNLGSITSGAGAPYLGIFLYPLNGDASTYGDGRFGSSAAGPPPSSYWVSSIPLILSVTQAQEGTTGIFPIPFGKFKLVAYNASGATLASGSNTIYLKTLNRQVA